MFDIVHQACRGILLLIINHMNMRSGLPLVGFLFKSTMLFQRFHCLSIDTIIYYSHDACTVLILSSIYGLEMKVDECHTLCDSDLQ